MKHRRFAREFTRHVKQRPTQFFDRTYPKVIEYDLHIPNAAEKWMVDQAKTRACRAH
jgi:hypothetical protein